MDSNKDAIKTAIEIGMLAGRLNAINQSYVLNTVNALLFSQQTSEPVDSNQEENVSGQVNDDQK